MLSKVSEILKSTFRKSDCVARIGGDEFLILMPQILDKSHVAEKAKRILQEFPIVMKDESGKNRFWFL